MLGPSVQLGAEEKYYPTCFQCYRRELLKQNQVPREDWGTFDSLSDTDNF